MMLTRKELALYVLMGIQDSPSLRVGLKFTLISMDDNFVC